ncbi:DUF6221 family protein [Streptomyces spectabilis]|uniref:Uncharacterized protein n=1 Tax=Streptomyces spectabilis TaxID=68270 RepID=A0A7W8B4B3_STRST|nr:DUF6221 family protein [Streptomyces spectabilis]MBB5108950.1 hypothetical protein [Streptomyces spectabilis]
MDDRVQWLHAQLDEDERIARAASGSTAVGKPGNWTPSPAGDEWEAFEREIEGEAAEGLLVAMSPGLPRPADVASGGWAAWICQDPHLVDPAAGVPMPALVHAALHDPARVLREIDAKRAIVRDLAEVIEASKDYKGPDYYEGVDACERTLARLALPYADRPGYREEWRP